MNTTELREKSPEDLEQELKQLRREHFNLRMQKTTGQLTRHHTIKQVRKQIARVRTIIQEKQDEGTTS